MNNFEFVSPTKIYFGKNQQNKIGQIIKEYGYKKVLLHYGKNSIKKIGLYDEVINSLKINNVQYIELGGVEPNPKISLVREGVKIAKKEQVDFILAVGGGSVIDSAKAIACGALVDFDPWMFSEHKSTVKQCLPIGVILTISAAGSELSNSCVISNEDTKIKNGFNSDLIRPTFSIMNPELTFSVSKYQTACGIVDIMMHTMERYFSDVDDLMFSDNIAFGLLKSVISAGKRVMKNPNDYNARATLMIASSFSHNGLTGLGSNFYFTVHKLEHVLSGLYDEISHGAGLSILFPAWAKYTSYLLKDKWVNFAKNVLEINESNPDDMIEMAIDELGLFFELLNMPITLHEVGIKSDEFEKIASRATINGNIPGVKKLDFNDVISILKLCE